MQRVATADQREPTAHSAVVSTDAVPMRKRRRSTRAVGLLISLGLLALVLLLSLAIGSKQIPFGTVIRAFTDFDGSNDHLVVRELRLPRTHRRADGGRCAGGGRRVDASDHPQPAWPIRVCSASTPVRRSPWCSASGCWMLRRLSSYVWLAFVGAALTSVVVYLLGSMGRGGATPVRLALAGAALSALLGSFTMAVVLLDKNTLDLYRFWAVGSLSGRDETVMLQVAPFIVDRVGAGDAVRASAEHARSRRGDSSRRWAPTLPGLELRPRSAVALLCGAATAACGPIGFIGLVVPLAARSIAGPDQRWLLPYSAVLGPVVLLSATWSAESSPVRQKCRWAS